MTWITIQENETIPLYQSFRHLMRTRIKSFFRLRNQAMPSYETRLCPLISHDEIEKEIHYLTTDVPVEEPTFHQISTEPVSKYQRLAIWYDILESCKDAKFEHDMSERYASDRVYSSDWTNRFAMRCVQIIFLLAVLFYFFKHSHTVTPLIYILLLLLICYI